MYDADGWRSRAACLAEITDLWFDEDPAVEAAALAYCSICPVQSECRAHASAYKEEHGIWGGLRAYVPEERDILHAHPPAHIPNQLPETKY